MKKLRDYQKDSLAFTMPIAHPGVGMEMRMGKTLVAIRRIKLYADCRSVLVVGPYSTLANWFDDLTEEGEDFVHIYGSREKRLKLLESAQDVIRYGSRKRYWVITNKEIYLSVPEIAGPKWDVVVFDESSSIKEPPGYRKGSREPNITKFYLEHFRGAKHRWILTGDLMPESPLNCFCQMRFLDPNIFQEKTFWQFRHTHFYRIGFDWRVKPESLPYIQSRIASAMIIIHRSDVNMAGIKEYQRRMVELPKDLRKMYLTVEEKFLLEIAGREINSTIYATQSYLWMRRLCGGFIDTSFASGHKVDALVELLRGDLKNQQAVIWAQYKAEVLMLSNMLKCPYIMGSIDPMHRDKIRRKFQNGEHPYVVIQPETMKMGSKWSAADAMVYYSAPDRNTTRRQTEDRMVDMESRKGALIIDLCCFDTIEEDILFGYIQKRSQSNTVESVIRSVQRRRRENGDY